MRRYKAPKTITGHIGVASCEENTGEDAVFFRHCVRLREGWAWYSGPNRGLSEANISSVSMFLSFHPIAYTSAVDRRPTSPTTTGE